MLCVSGTVSYGTKSDEEDRTADISGPTILCRGLTETRSELEMF